MASVRERLATLESQNEQCAKERGELQAARRSIESLRQDVARLRAWQAKVSSAAAWLGRRVALTALIVGAETASGVWGRLLRELARQLGR